MKFISVKYLCILILLSCNNPKSESAIEVSKNTLLTRDSLKAHHRAILAFKDEINSAQDSLKKYNLNDANDTCIKFIYTLNGRDTLRNSDNLTINKIAIRLTQLRQIKGSLFELKYSFFINDSIPIWPDLLEGTVLHTFDYDTTAKEILKVHLGQHTSYMGGKDVISWYQGISKSASFNEFILSNKHKFHRIYLRLL